MTQLNFKRMKQDLALKKKKDLKDRKSEWVDLWVKKEKGV